MNHLPATIEGYNPQYVSNCRALALRSDQTHTLEFATLEAEVKKIVEEIKEVQSRVQVRRGHIVQAKRTLERMEYALTIQLIKAKEELDRLEKGDDSGPMTDEEAAKLYDPDPLEQIHQQQLAEEAHRQEIERTTSRKQKKKAKELYQKIIRLCHPDRTYDQHLMELVPLANNFYAEYNVENLGQLLGSIENYLKSRQTPEWLRKNVMKRKENVLQARNDVLRQEANVLASGDWQLVRWMESGQFDMARAHYRAAMEQDLAMTRGQLEAIKRTRAAQSVYSNSGNTYTGTFTPNFFRRG